MLNYITNHNVGDARVVTVIEEDSEGEGYSYELSGAFRCPGSRAIARAFGIPHDAGKVGSTHSYTSVFAAGQTFGLGS